VCAFCAIPAIRGKFQSRALESVVAEARMLASQGVRELNVISQDTLSYGKDLPAQARPRIADLIRALDEVESVDWVRFLYLYPSALGDDVIDAFAGAKRVLRYLDVPLQHASDRLLRAMKRGVTAERQRRLVEKLRARLPGCVLRTTFIVGFPGESDRQFQTLCSFARDAEFDHVGVFTYSEEKGTSAADLPDDVPAELKEERRAALMAIQEDIAARRAQALVGRVVEVLIDGPPEDSDLLLCGRTEGQAPEIDGRVILTDAPGPLNPGTFVQVRIDEAHPYDLVGAVVEPVHAGHRP